MLVPTHVRASNECVRNLWLFGMTVFWEGPSLNACPLCSTYALSGRQPRGATHHYAQGMSWANHVSLHQCQRGSSAGGYGFCAQTWKGTAAWWSSSSCIVHLVRWWHCLVWLFTCIAVEVCGAPHPKIDLWECVLVHAADIGSGWFLAKEHPWLCTGGSGCNAWLSQTHRWVWESQYSNMLCPAVLFHNA